MALSILSFKKIKTLQDFPKKIEVTYQKIVPKSQKSNSSQTKNLKVVKREPKITEKVEIIPKDKHVPALMRKSIKDISKLNGKFMLEKKSMRRVSSLSGRGKIKIPLLKSEKITNVKYLTYNQSIREKIKQKAYDYIDHPDFKEGEVYLTFILASTGFLREIKIIEEKTTANDYLREIGMKCIRESSPFPPFPEDLNYPELTFNVIISFEIQE